MHHYAPACVAPNVHATWAAWKPPVLEMIMMSGIGTADQEPGPHGCVGSLIIQLCSSLHSSCCDVHTI